MKLASFDFRDIRHTYSREATSEIAHAILHGHRAVSGVLPLVPNYAGVRPPASASVGPTRGRAGRAGTSRGRTITATVTVWSPTE